MNFSLFLYIHLSSTCWYFPSSFILNCGEVKWDMANQEVGVDGEVGEVGEVGDNT